MEELQDLIKFLKDKGLEHQKINVDVLCGIIEYFANKQETKQCNIADVSNRRELLIGLLTKLENGGGSAFIDKEQIVDDYLKGN